MAKVTVEPLNLEVLRDQVDSWYAVKRQTAMLDKKLSDGKEKLKTIVQRYGEKEPDKGSLLLNLGGLVSDRKIACLKNQRTVTQSINKESAERILKRKKLWSQLTRTVEILDQEKVYAAFYDGKLTEEDMEQIFTQSVHFSLILLDDNDKPVS